MQRNTRGVLLALVAVLAMSAVTAAAASATTPEFNPVPAKKKFTGSSGTLVWQWSAEKIECSKTSTTGSITGARNVGDVVMVLMGCKSSSPTKSNCPINSKGAKAGEIVTAPLTGELGTVTKTSAVGLRLKAETGKKWFEAVGNACTEEAVWTGSVAAPVEPIGKKQTTSRLTFTTPNPTEIKLDSGEIEKPELVTFSDEVGTETTDTLTFEEAVEVT